MFTPKLVALILAALVFIVLLWDVFLTLDGVRRNTISQVLHDYDERHRWVRLVFGVVTGLLLGHFFWPV